MAQLYTDIVNLLEQAKSDIQAQMASQNINASGRTSDSFHVVEADGHIMLVMGGHGTAPLATLEIGRGAGKIPYGFIDILVEWSIAKGIYFPDNRQRKTFAWFLSQKIKDKGTLRHTAPKDIYSTIVHDAVEQLKPMIVQAVKDNFKSTRKKPTP